MLAPWQIHLPCLCCFGRRCVKWKKVKAATAQSQSPWLQSQHHLLQVLPGLGVQGTDPTQGNKCFLQIRCNLVPNCLRAEGSEEVRSGVCKRKRKPPNSPCVSSSQDGRVSLELPTELGRVLCQKAALQCSNKRDQPGEGNH